MQVPHRFLRIRCHGWRIFVLRMNQSTSRSYSENRFTKDTKNSTFCHRLLSLSTLQSVSQLGVSNCRDHDSRKIVILRTLKKSGTELISDSWSLNRHLTWSTPQGRTFASIRQNALNLLSLIQLDQSCSHRNWPAQLFPHLNKGFQSTHISKHCSG